MLRFPFNTPPPQNEPVPEQKALVKTDETHKAEDGFSPELSLLLSMAMKDGMVDSNMRKMFEDVMPFVSEKEKRTINRIINRGGEQELDAQMSSLKRSSSLAGYSKQSRQQDMIDILERYATEQGGEMMQQYKRSMQMQNDFEEMGRKIDKLGNMQNAKPEDMIEVMSMFMKDEELGQMKNMQNMMRLFGSMNGAKPEDMLKFLNLNKK